LMLVSLAQAFDNARIVDRLLALAAMAATLTVTILGVYST
jgi:hypothetical protein